MEAVAAALGIDNVVESVSSNLSASDIARWAATEQGLHEHLRAPGLAQRRGVERGVGALPSLETLFVSEALRTVPRTTVDACFAVSRGRALRTIRTSRTIAPSHHPASHHQHDASPPRRRATQKIFFDTASHDICGRHSRKVLKALAALGKRLPELSFGVDGHVGDACPPSIRGHYSFARAVRCAALLERYGADPAAIRLTAFGSLVSLAAGWEMGWGNGRQQDAIAEAEGGQSSSECSRCEIFITLDGVTFPKRPDRYEGVGGDISALQTEYNLTAGAPRGMFWSSDEEEAATGGGGQEAAEEKSADEGGGVEEDEEEDDEGGSEGAAGGVIGYTYTAEYPDDGESEEGDDEGEDMEEEEEEEEEEEVEEEEEEEGECADEGGYAQEDEGGMSWEEADVDAPDVSEGGGHASQVWAFMDP